MTLIRLNNGQFFISDWPSGSFCTDVWIYKEIYITLTDIEGPKVTIGWGLSFFELWEDQFYCVVRPRIFSFSKEANTWRLWLSKDLPAVDVNLINHKSNGVYTFYLLRSFRYVGSTKELSQNQKPKNLFCIALLLRYAKYLKSQ